MPTSYTVVRIDIESFGTLGQDDEEFFLQLMGRYVSHENKCLINNK